MLTVAISTHGGYARYLPQAAASALRHADEVIVYDDGGECEPPEGVRYVALPKSGFVTAARRRAIAEAQGEYLLHLDADDWLISRPEPEGDWYYSDTYLCDERGTVRGAMDYSIFPRERDEAYGFLAFHRTLPVPMKAVFRTAWLRAHGFGWYEWPSTTFAEDCRTCIEYLSGDPSIVYGSQPFYVYRLHERQDSRDAERRSVFLADLDRYLKGELE